MTLVKVGLCGASMGLTTLRRWRASAPPAFEFTVKAWQLITHEAKSSTYRRLRTPLSAEERTELGTEGFRWTPIVARAWDTTLSCAAALEATAILLQCPANFRPAEPAIARLREFSPERVGRPVYGCCGSRAARVQTRWSGVCARSWT